MAYICDLNLPPISASPISPSMPSLVLFIISMVLLAFVVMLAFVVLLVFVAMLAFAAMLAFCKWSAMPNEKFKIP